MVIFCLSSLASSELIQLPLRPFREGSQKTVVLFFGEEELYPSLLGGSVFEPTKDYSSSKRHYDLLATNNKKRHLFLFPFFCHLISTSQVARKSPCKNIQKKKKAFSLIGLLFFVGFVLIGDGRDKRRHRPPAGRLPHLLRRKCIWLSK